MRRAILSVLLFSLIALLPHPPSAAGQYDLDVKTRFEEMARLRSVKQGVKAILEDQAWASVVEFGEDYSLWLTDLDRRHRGEYLHVDLTVALRTPAMLGTGEHIDAERVQLRYHWEQMRSRAQDLPDLESVAESKAEELGTSLVRAMGASDQSARQLGGELLSALARLPEYPSRVEALESLLLGQKVAKSAQTMITGEAPAGPDAGSDMSSAPSIVSTEATPDPAVVQETIRFSVSARNATRYRWVFGNGTTATGQSVTHTFRRPGRHEVKVVAFSSRACDTRSVSVNVEAAPQRRLYGTLRSVMMGLSSPWANSGSARGQLRESLEKLTQESADALLSGLRDEFPGAVSDVKSLLKTSRRALEKIEAQHQPFLLRQYSTALKRTHIYQEQRSRLDVPESMNGGLALYTAVTRSLNRYTSSTGSTSDLIAAYRQANHVCPVLRCATRSSQGVAGTLENSLDKTLRTYRRTLGLLQEVISQELQNRSLQPPRCTR